MDFIARICFWVPIVSVAGTDGRSFCWGEDVVGMLSDGWFDFSVGFILGYPQSQLVISRVRRTKKKLVVRQDPKKSYEVLGRVFVSRLLV